MSADTSSRAEYGDTDTNPHDDDSTLSLVYGPRRERHGLWARRVTVSLIFVLVAVAATGWLGVHSSTVTASGHGYQLTVRYAQVARAGLDVPFTLRVTAPEAISGDIVIGISADYFRMFETQGFFPEPSDTTSDADTVFLTFAPPPTGKVLVVDYDAYIQPANQIGKSATITVFVDGEPQVSTRITTELLP